MKSYILEVFIRFYRTLSIYTYNEKPIHLGFQRFMTDINQKMSTSRDIRIRSDIKKKKRFNTIKTGTVLPLALLSRITIYVLKRSSFWIIPLQFAFNQKFFKIWYSLLSRPKSWTSSTKDVLWTLDKLRSKPRGGRGTNLSFLKEPSHLKATEVYLCIIFYSMHSIAWITSRMHIVKRGG